MLSISGLTLSVADDVEVVTVDAVDDVEVEMVDVLAADWLLGNGRIRPNFQSIFFTGTVRKDALANLSA